jgi:hypothetical protein
VNLEEFRLLPEQFLHGVAIHVLEKHAKKLKSRVTKLELIAHMAGGLKLPAVEEEIRDARLELAKRALKDMQDSIAVLTKEREAKLRRAKMQVVR